MILERLIGTSSELIARTEFKNEKEFIALMELIRNKVGNELFEEYEILISDYEYEEQIKAYKQGFKDAFRLFKELEL